MAAEAGLGDEALPKCGEVNAWLEDVDLADLGALSKAPPTPGVRPPGPPSSPSRFSIPSGGPPRGRVAGRRRGAGGEMSPLGPGLPNLGATWN